LMLRDLEAFLRYVSLIAVRFYLLTYLLTYLLGCHHADSKQLMGVRHRPMYVILLGDDAPWHVLIHQVQQPLSAIHVEELNWKSEFVHKRGIPSTVVWRGVDSVQNVTTVTCSNVCACK